MVSSSSLRSSCSRLLGLNGIDSPEKDGAWARCTSEGSTEHSSVHSSGRRRQRQVRTGGSGRSPRVPPRRSPCRPRVNRPSTHSVQRATRCISMTRRGGPRWAIMRHGYRELPKAKTLFSRIPFAGKASCPHLAAPLGRTRRFEWLWTAWSRSTGKRCKWRTGPQ